jgi:hypothetical protein
VSVTEIQRARWTSRGEVVHIQVCDYPNCPSRHSRVDGPATPGWVAFGNTKKQIILCPFHSTGEHRPSLTPLTQLPARLRAECSCGWSGSLSAQVPPAVMEWQDHVAEQEYFQPRAM